MTSSRAEAVRETRPLVDLMGGHMVSPAWAARVVSPLHDVLSESQRRTVLAHNPDSYLHVTSDPLALPEPPGDAAAESVQAQALQRLLDRDAYVPVREPALFVYRLTDRGRDHTGVIAAVSVEGFHDGRVLGHERVQPERVAALVQHYRRVPLRSELVALFHPADREVAELTSRVVEQPPLLHFTDASGVEQAVWQVGAAETTTLVRGLGGQRLYIADGHHRVAAALRSWELAGRPGSGSVLCAVYPQDEIVLHAFHRRVRGPVPVPELLEALSARFEIGPDHRHRDGSGDDSRLPSGEIGLYAAGTWWRLRSRERGRRAGTAGLHVTMLDRDVLRPILGVDHGDPRLEFVPALRELDTTTRLCDDDGGVLFTLPAPSIEDVVAVAERHEVMSPKTTYVQPKPRTGIFLS